MSHIDPRPISGTEFAVLQAVLARAPASDAPSFASDTLQKLTVYSKCDCGCASIGFLPEGTRANENTKLIADGLGLSVDHKQIGVIVYGSSEQIVELELYWLYTDGAPLPRPETIVPWKRRAEVAEAEE